MHRRADIIGKGQISSNKHRDHAWCGLHSGKIQPADHPTRHGRQGKGQMQAALRGWNIIHISRGARNVQARAVMGHGGVNAHGVTSSTDTGVPWRSA